MCTKTQKSTCWKFRLEMDQWKKTCFLHHLKMKPTIWIFEEKNPEKVDYLKKKSDKNWIFEREKIWQNEI